MMDSSRPTCAARRRPDITRDERGLTLIEVAVVGVLATIVMLALTGFYISSQGTWIDASSQALTQREVSLVLGTIADSVRAASSADVNAGTHTLTLFSPGSIERCWFKWDLSDSLIHEGKGALDRGPMATSRVTRFDLSGTTALVSVTALEMRTANGKLVRMSTSSAFFNR